MLLSYTTLKWGRLSKILVQSRFAVLYFDKLCHTLEEEAEQWLCHFEGVVLDYHALNSTLPKMLISLLQCLFITFAKSNCTVFIVQLLFPFSGHLVYLICFNGTAHQYILTLVLLPQTLANGLIISENKITLLIVLYIWNKCGLATVWPKGSRTNKS